MKSPWNRFYRRGAKIYDRIERIWRHRATHIWISRILAYVFILSLALGYAVYEGLLPARGVLVYFKNPFVAIEITFTVLLVIEIFGLIFAIPVSVTHSVIKQFELLSLIFIRMGLKQFSHLHNLFDWSEMQSIVTSMFVYGFGALLIFMIIGWQYKLQRKLKIREYFREYPYYKSVKKNIALVLISVFISLTLVNLYLLVTGNPNLLSFKHFYTALIFSDILILVISMRYILDYHSMFRYSGYILATIFIRIALTSPPYYDILIGTGAAVYLILLTWTYNIFMNRKITKKPRYIHFNPEEQTFITTHGKNYSK
jgi:hypothetical protein